MRFIQPFKRQIQSVYIVHPGYHGR